MTQAPSRGYFRSWTPAGQEPGHPLARLEGETIASRALRVLLGPSSRFGARYFAVFLDGALSQPIMRGLHHSGPYPSYNWVEVAETNERVGGVDGEQIDAGEGGLERLFALLVGLLPPGGHLMVEYDSPQRAETARELAHNVPALATPLGELLFRAGCGAHFKDWQIAEGGAEGPRKLQAYKPLTEEVARRWRREALAELRAFLDGGSSVSDTFAAARERALALLRDLSQSSPAP